MALILLSTWLVGLIVSHAQPAQEAADTRVGGLVVDARTHAPVSGARVLLTSVDVTQRLPDGAAGPLRQAVTDADGRFTFEGIATGRYKVEALKAGFAAPVHLSDLRTIEVGNGQLIADLEVLLERAGVIEGRIVDASGRPLSGIVISALSHERDAAGVAAPVQLSATNGLGDFRITGLPEGEYVLSATPNRSAPLLSESLPTPAGGTALALTYYPGTIDRDAAHVVSVASGETVSGVQFAMVPVAAFDVSGVVVDESGAPVAGILVFLMLSSPGGGPSMAAITASAGADGTFRIGAVEPGKYRLTAIWPTGSIGGGIAAPQGRGVEVTVDNADVADLRIIAPPRR